MIAWSDTQIWAMILLLGFGTFMLRFSFLGLIGDRKLPPWIERMLRYTPVAVLPGMVAPAVLFPAAAGGDPDAIRLAAALGTLVIGWATRSVIWALVTGLGLLFGLSQLFG